MKLIAGTRYQRRNGTISPPLDPHPHLDGVVVDPETGVNFAIDNATEFGEPDYAFVISPKATIKDDDGNIIPGDEHPHDLMGVAATE